MRYSLSYLFLLLVSVLFISGTASALPIAVVPGNSHQNNNSTTNSTDSLTYVSVLNITVMESISGNFTISYDGIGAGDFARIYLNASTYGVECEACLTSSWATHSQEFNGVLIAGSSIQLMMKKQAVTAQGRNLNLSYSYVPVPSIISPVNNSVQTSRIVNITTDSTFSSTQFQVCTEATCSAPYIDTTVSTNYSGNITLVAGVNYIRVKGYLDGSETEWSTIQVDVHDSIIQSGGIGYNWSLNGTFDNSSWDRGDNRIWGSATYRNNFAGGDCNNLLLVNGEYGCEVGYMWVNRTGASSYLRFNETNFTNTYIEIDAKRTVDLGTNLFGILGRMGINSLVYPNIRFALRDDTTYHYIDQMLSTGQISLASNATGGSFDPSTRFHMAALLNGTGYRYKAWYGATSPNWFVEQNMTFNDPVNSSGNIGVYTGNMNMTYYSIHSRPVDTNGTIILVSNYTFNELDLQDEYLSVIRATIITSYYDGSSSNISIDINTSNDGVTYSGWTRIANNIVNNVSYPVPYANRQHKVIRRYVLNNVPRILNDYVYSTTEHVLTNSVDGYVKYPNGTAISGAKYGYFEHWNTTGTDGYYLIENLPYPYNISIVAGKSGLNSTGDVLYFNGSNYYHDHNFTLDTYTAPVLKNLAAIEMIYNMTTVFGLAYNLTGQYSNSYFPESVYPVRDIADGKRLGVAYPVIYDSGYNVTPEFYERMLSIFEYQRSYVESGQRRFQVDILMSMYENAYTHLSSQMLTRFNNTILDINYTTYEQWGAINNSTNNLHNFAYFEAHGDQMRIYFGLETDTTFVDKFMEVHLNNTVGKNGYWINNADGGLSYHYNPHKINMINEMQKNYKYIPVNNSFNSTLSEGVNWIKNMFLQDGTMVYGGRSMAGANQLGALAWAASTIDDSQSQYIFDLTYSKSRQYNTYRNYTYYTNINYYDPTYDGEFYYGWQYLNHAGIWFLASAYRNFNSSLVETSFKNINGFDDFDHSGIIKTDMDDDSTNGKVYSVYFPSLYSDGLEVTSYSGDTMIPLRFVATINDSMNYTFSPTPVITHGTYAKTSIHQYNQEGFDNYDFENIGWNFISFNGNTKRLNASAFSVYGKINNDTQINKVNIHYGLGHNLLWMNWTNISFLDGSSFGYLNLSVRNIGDKLHITYKFNGNGLNNFSLPLSFITEDNRTTATRWENNSEFWIKRGNEWVNITNQTGINTSGFYIVNSNSNSGFSPFGWSNRTYLAGDISGSGDAEYSFDVKISTANVYPYIFNVPPGIFSKSPETPVTMINGTSQTFDIEFTQNLNTIQWQVNNVTVGWNNGTSIGSYINSTATIGTHEINATGCNAQGCATQLWQMTVNQGTYIPPTPISCTSTNTTTSINVSCQANPIGNGTDGMNMSRIGVGWQNGTTFYQNFTGLNEGTEYTIHAYAWNNTGVLSAGYAIVSDTTQVSGPPNITSWGNTKTNNQSLNFTVNITESVIFNVTANQTIANWSWSKDGYEYTPNTDSHTHQFIASNRTINLSVYGNNSNGTTQYINWSIYVFDNGSYIAPVVSPNFIPYVDTTSGFTVLDTEHSHFNWSDLNVETYNETAGVGDKYIDLYFNSSVVTNGSGTLGVISNIKYEGGSGHVVGVYIYNFTSSVYDNSCGTIIQYTAFEYNNCTGVSKTHYINSTNITIVRVNHTGNGNHNHRVFIDEAKITLSLPSSTSPHSKTYIYPLNYSDNFSSLNSTFWNTGNNSGGNVSVHDGKVFVNLSGTVANTAFISTATTQRTYKASMEVNFTETLSTGYLEFFKVQDVEVINGTNAYIAGRQKFNLLINSASGVMSILLINSTGGAQYWDEAAQAWTLDESTPGIPVVYNSTYNITVERRNIYYEINITNSTGTQMSSGWVFIKQLRNNTMSLGDYLVYGDLNTQLGNKSMTFDNFSMSWSDGIISTGQNYTNDVDAELRLDQEIMYNPNGLIDGAEGLWQYVTFNNTHIFGIENSILVDMVFFDSTHAGYNLNVFTDNGTYILNVSNITTSETNKSYQSPFYFGYPGMFNVSGQYPTYLVYANGTDINGSGKVISMNLTFSLVDDHWANTSVFYSITLSTVTGNVTINGTVYDVTGFGSFEHAWNEQNTGNNGGVNTGEYYTIFPIGGYSKGAIVYYQVFENGSIRLNDGAVNVEGYRLLTNGSFVVDNREVNGSDANYTTTSAWHYTSSELNFIGTFTKADGLFPPHASLMPGSRGMQHITGNYTYLNSTKLEFSDSKGVQYIWGKTFTNPVWKWAPCSFGCQTIGSKNIGNLNVTANVTAFNSSYTIVSVYFNLSYPNGTTIVNNEGTLQSGTNQDGVWAYPANSADIGFYVVTVWAIDNRGLRIRDTKLLYNGITMSNSNYKRRAVIWVD